MALTVVQQLDPICVDVSQSTTVLLRLRRRVGGGPLPPKQGPTHPGRRHNVCPERNASVPRCHRGATTGSVTLEVVVPNPKGLLLPGMFLRALVQEGINQEAILIPQQAVSRDPQGNPVALIIGGEGKVAQRMLTLDRAISDQWLVASGLAPGERVIVEGIQKVRPGAAVKVVPFQEGGTNGAAPKKAAQSAAKSN